MSKRKPIDFRVDEKTGCFLITSHKPNKRGYIYVNGELAHRFVYEQCFGEVPDGKNVVRKCGNNNCINPEHFALTTQAEVCAQVSKKYVARPIDFDIDPVTECFNCTSHPADRSGYHRIMVNNKPNAVHRFVYEQMFGEIPEGLVVRHRCDNPHCINPAHLLLGTRYDNMQDKVERDRQAKGSKHGNAKLTEDDVREIRKRLAAGDGVNYLARVYEVDPAIIVRIKQNKIWKHVTID